MTDLQINSNQTIISARAELYQLRQEKIRHKLEGNFYKTNQLQKEIESLEREIQTAINYMRDA